MPSKPCETLLYLAVSHILTLVRLPGEYLNNGLLRYTKKNIL